MYSCELRTGVHRSGAESSVNPGSVFENQQTILKSFCVNQAEGRLFKPFTLILYLWFGSIDHLL